MNAFSRFEPPMPLEIARNRTMAKCVSFQGPTVPALPVFHAIRKPGFHGKNIWHTSCQVPYQNVMTFHTSVNIILVEEVTWYLTAQLMYHISRPGKLFDVIIPVPSSPLSIIWTDQFIKTSQHQQYFSSLKLVSRLSVTRWLKSLWTPPKRVLILCLAPKEA